MKVSESYRASDETLGPDRSTHKMNTRPEVRHKKVEIIMAASCCSHNLILDPLSLFDKSSLINPL
jgi:hypothetical protein